jgi:hypothetical protein
MRRDGEGNPRPRLLSEHLEDRVAGRPKDLDTRRGVQGVRVGTFSSLADYPHVELHGVRIGVNLDDRRLCPVLVDVLVEGDQSWLVHLDEVTESWDSLLSSSSLPSLSLFVAMNRRALT